METLKRRAEALAREIDLRRQMAGEPSVLDLRPVGGPEVEAFLTDWRRLLVIDSWSGRAHTPYDVVSHWIDRTGRTEMARRTIDRLTEMRNKWVEDNRPEK